jgi:hypothetical protein
MKDLFRRNHSALLALLTLVGSSIGWGQTSSFTDTYTGQGSNATTCNTSFSITGQEPSASGTFPVFVYMVGTTESFNNDGAASASVSRMAAKGFVSASIQYDSGSFGNCTQISGKAKCIFDPASRVSAITKLCNRAKADCSKGVVVGGFSQGAVMATLSANFNSQVKAAWGMGDGTNYSSFNLTACMANGNRTLSSNNLRAVDGQADEFIGPQESTVRTHLQSLTGFNCGSSATSCLQGNGSGWIIVTNGEVSNADHCYMRTNGCFSSETTDNSAWLNGTAPWALNANLAWLAGFAQ